MSSKEKFSVLIPDGWGDISVFVARCLSEAPHVRVHVLSDSFFDAIHFSRHIHSFHVQEMSYRKEDQLDIISDYMKKTKADILLPVKFSMTRYLSHHLQTISKRFPVVPIADINIFNIANNKWLLAEFLRRHNIPHPRTLLCFSDECFEDCISDLHFPVLIKPSLGDSGKGIVYFNDQKTLLDFLNENRNTTSQLIIQERICGFDIGCSVLCRNGKILAHTIQKGIRSSCTAFSNLSQLEFIKDNSIYEVIEKLISVLKWNGIAHIDMMYDEEDQQVKIIEINPRYWASLLGSLSAGVNFPYLACLEGLGIPFEKPDYKCIPFFVSGKMALKHGFKRSSAKKEISFKWRQTNWNYGVRDPLAELFMMLDRHSGIYRKIFSRD